MSPPARRKELANFILDVLQHDTAEPIGSIVKMLNNDGCIGWRVFWPRDFTMEEVSNELRSMVQRGWVDLLVSDDERNVLVKPKDEVRELSSDLSSLWFACTDKGRAAWEEWQPPIE